jgi:hypothetical protein
VMLKGHAPGNPPIHLEPFGYRRSRRWMNGGRQPDEALPLLL